MKIYIGADHRGYYLKEKIARWLLEWKHDFEDMGADHFDADDDYTLYAERVASMVAEKDTDKDKGKRKGILLCGSGVGVDVMANKFDGIRASIGKSVSQVEAGRRDDDMNVLVIAADYTTDDEAQKMVKVFLETKFEKKARRLRRLEDIAKIEQNN